ncbi:unnamed protein product [Durusdinium trenchii]|uniref:Uncharacterized protein n=1 Tax=Durusdinium trenchii TaxID=1381693 RepID=A0ABP0IK23_9DINO
MSLSSFRIDRADLASTASDRCSEDSFGVVGSVEDRLKTDRSSKLAAFKERQVKNFQRPPIASVASTSSLRRSQTEGAAESSEVLSLSRLNTARSIDGESNSPVPLVSDMTKQLVEIKEQQESVTQKIFAAIASSDQVSVETKNQLSRLQSRLEEVEGEASQKRREVLQQLSQLQEKFKEHQSHNSELKEGQQELKAALTRELEGQNASLKALQQTSKEAQAQLEELKVDALPKKRVLESLKVDMEQLPELCRLVGQQGRLIDAIRAQDLGERVGEMQRVVETQGRSLEALRTQEASCNSDIQRSFEANMAVVQCLRTKGEETGQHVADLQRLVESQSRTVESLRSQSLQVQETLQGQDPDKRLSDLKRSTDGIAELFQELKGRMLESASKLQEVSSFLEKQETNLQGLSTQSSTMHQSLTAVLLEILSQLKELPSELGTKVAELSQTISEVVESSQEQKLFLEAAQAGINNIKEEQSRSFGQLQERQQTSVGKVQSTLSEYRADMAAWQSEAAEQLQQAMQTHAQEFQALQSKMAIYGTQLSEQDRQLQQLTKTAATQKSLEQFMLKMDAQHKAHVEEMHRLQKSFANESECQGLRMELDASKKSQRSLEGQQAIQERSWEEERAKFEKEVARLQAREASLVQQLQQAIVEVPITQMTEPVEAERSLRSFLPPPPRKPPFLTLGVAAVGGLLLASLAAHFKWHKAPEPPSKPQGFRVSRVFRRVKNGIHVR